MGKFVKPLDIEAETAKVMSAVRKYLKTVTCNVGDVDYDRLINDQICVIVDNDGKLGSDIGSMLGKLKNVSNVFTVELRGSYDWSADTYIRPSSSILITFSK